MCKYCEVNVNDRQWLLKTENHEVYIGGKGNLFMSPYPLNVSIKLNYCPICGKDLRKVEK